MSIYQMEVGALQTNCYVPTNEETRHCVVIDPGAEGERILTALRKGNLTVDAILLTHGHSDHIGGVADLREATGAPVYISAGDADCLTNPRSNLSLYMFGTRMEGRAADHVVHEGDQLTLAGMTFSVLETPGHTPGGVCYVLGEGDDMVVFCGDTIFAESIGRTDFPGGSYDTLLKSIKNKILTLPDEAQLLPGHGPGTSVGWERKRNPFLQ